MGYLNEQLITYLGNKRKLLNLIQTALDQTENVTTIIDLFSGSGVVSRYFKENGYNTISNDLEDYAKTINECYMSNSNDFDLEIWHNIHEKIINYPLVEDGIISRLYAPKDTNNIQPNERVFYTRENAILLDTYRTAIQEVCPENYKKFFLAPLLSQASIHTNTSGVFKGFYKGKSGIGKFGGEGANALERIMGTIKLEPPVLSSKQTNYAVYQEDANSLSKKITGDLAYLDPPYNQHPYGSNYHMLTTINNYTEPKNISKVSGIPADWNRSKYNVQSEVGATLDKLINDLQVKYVILSYNSEGFLSYDEIVDILTKYGDVQVFYEEYNTFRGSRNLNNRPLTVNEYVFLLTKNSTLQ